MKRIELMVGVSERAIFAVSKLMKSRLALCSLAFVWLVFGTVSGWAQGSDTNASSLPPLVMTPTDVAELPRLSDAQLEVFINELAATPQIPFSAIPVRGSTFFSLAHPDFPPFPGDINSNSVWAMDGFYLLNDVTSSPATATAMKVSSVARAAAKASGPPSPGGGGGGTNSVPLGTSYPPPNFGTNLWIALPSVTGGYLTANASNTVADVAYQILSATNLQTPASNWNSEGLIYGSEVTNWTPLGLIPQGARTNLFIRLLSWASSDGSGLPDWWELQFFGNTGIDPNGDPAGDGWSNIQKYQNGWNPQVFYTPPTPQGISVIFYASNKTAKVSWLPSPGNVTGYTVYDIFHGATNYHAMGPTVTSYSEIITNQPGAYYWQGDPTIYEAFQVGANYAKGNSPISAAVPLEYSLSTEIVYGPPRRGLSQCAESAGRRQLAGRFALRSRQ